MIAIGNGGKTGVVTMGKLRGFGRKKTFGK
jgi:hypothetical protein